MDEVLESVVAENRELQKEVKLLRARVTALETSRWWKLHPREVLRRIRTRQAPANGTRPAHDGEKIKRAAESWRLKVAYRRRISPAAPDEVVIRDGITLKAHPASRGPFEEFCYWSPDVVRELDAFIENTGDRQRLLDIGAFHGLFSLVFAAHDPTRRALAVDASPVAFAPLLYNIHRNDAHNIVAVETALSSEDGSLDMHYEWDHAVAGDGNGGATLHVPATTGDALCSRHDFEPDVVKVDVEGHELRVLQGLRGTIRRNRPLLFLEVHPQMMGRDSRNGTVHALSDELRQLGYEHVELHGSIEPLDGIEKFDDITRVLLRPGGE